MDNLLKVVKAINCFLSSFPSLEYLSCHFCCDHFVPPHFLLLYGEHKQKTVTVQSQYLWQVGGQIIKQKGSVLSKCRNSTY